MKFGMFLIFGLAGIALSLYALDKTWALYLYVGSVDIQLVLFGFAALILFLAGIVNLAIAYAFSWGKVLAVRGSLDVPSVLLPDGLESTIKRIAFSKKIKIQNEKSQQDVEVVIFLSSFILRSCPADEFLNK